MLMEVAHWTAGELRREDTRSISEVAFAPFVTLTKRLADRIKDKKKVARSPDLA